MIYYKDATLISKDTDGANVLPVNHTFEFDDVNIFVGEQGTGKSTLLSILSSNNPNIINITENEIKKEDDDKDKEEIQPGKYYFNSEFDNPRTKNPEEFINAQNLLGYGGALLSRKKSHGEIMEFLLFDSLSTITDTIVFIDEPETGLSIKNQYKLIKLINEAVERGCQFFIATHSYLIIEAFDVICLDNNKKISGKEYIKQIEY